MPLSALAGCTVVTADYLPWVRVTAASFADHHPDAGFAVLVIDEPAPSQLRDDDQFTLLRPADVRLSEDELAWMDLIYSPVELCCALKPWLIRRMLDETEVVLYIDADICVYAPLTEVAEQARGAAVVLSPHSLAPRTDPRMPDDDALLQFGQFNGGFLAVSQNGRDFVDWWAARCARECTDWNPDVPRRYLDQRWLDLAIGYFDTRVTRDPGINVARWNMYQRDFDLVDGRCVVDGGPLRCFHFSAFNPAEPTNIRREGYTHPKVDPQQNAALRALLEDYAGRLVAAGWKPAVGSREPRRVAGIELTPAVRAAIRAALIDAERIGAVPADAARNPQKLVSWLQSPVTAAPTPPQSAPAPPEPTLTPAQPVSAAPPATRAPTAERPPIQVSDKLLAFTAECRFERQSILTAALRVAHELPPGSRLIDVGAGNSPYMELFTHLRYENTDWQHSPHPGARGVDHIGPAHDLPVGDGEYDAVLCTQVLEHVPNPQAVLRELHRVLRPGGRLYMTMPLAWELHELPFDFFRYTPHGLYSLLGAAGFEDLDIRPRNDCFETLGQLLSNVHTMVGSAADGRDPERAEAAATLRALGEKIAGYSGLDSRWIFPLGYEIAAVKAEEASRAASRRIHDQSVMAARAAIGLEGAREHVTLCFGTDLFSDPRLLEAYARHFSASDDATLAIYVPNSDVALASSRLMEVVARVGLDGPDAPDMIGLPFRATADERTLAHAVDAVLSFTPPCGPFAGLSWAHYGTLEPIRSEALGRDDSVVSNAVTA